MSLWMAAKHSCVIFGSLVPQPIRKGCTTSELFSFRAAGKRDTNKVKKKSCKRFFFFFFLKMSSCNLLLIKCLKVKKIYMCLLLFCFWFHEVWYCRTKTLESKWKEYMEVSTYNNNYSQVWIMQHYSSSTIIIIKKKVPILHWGFDHLILNST